MRFYWPCGPEKVSCAKTTTSHSQIVSSPQFCLGFFFLFPLVNPQIYFYEQFRASVQLNKREKTFVSFVQVSLMLVLHPSSQCDVCFDPYTWDESGRCPYTIPCGHAFCSPC